MTTSYRDAATVLWGDAGTYAHDAYARLRVHFPGLPDTLPIVIGITAYGHCDGLTRGTWQHGPRISLSSTAFTNGARYIDDLMTHEMTHAHLFVTGRDTAHQSNAWYEAIRRLSPAVLGAQVDVVRGADRRSVRVANPRWSEGSGLPRTVVRKQRVPDATPHADVARWPHTFRPTYYYTDDTPIICPTY